MLVQPTLLISKMTFFVAMKNKFKFHKYFLKKSYLGSIVIFACHSKSKPSNFNCSIIITQNIITIVAYKVEKTFSCWRWNFKLKTCLNHDEWCQRYANALMHHSFVDQLTQQQATLTTTILLFFKKQTQFTFTIF